MLKLFWIFGFICLYRDGVLSKSVDSKTPEKVIYQLDNIDELFKEFMAKYNKKYDATEYKHRQKVFEKNLIKLNQWNREQPDTVYGITPFTDLTFEEFMKTNPGVRGMLTNDDAIRFESAEKAPESLDWRKKNLVTPVRFETNCMLDSSIGNIEGQLAKRSGLPTTLSLQQIIDCYYKDHYFDWPHELFQMLAGRGCMKELDYPPLEIPGHCRENKTAMVAMVSGGKRISLNSEEDLKNALFVYGPLAIVMKLDEHLFHYKGGVIRPLESCQTSDFKLPFLLVGYDQEGGVPYWIIKGPFGIFWGDRGYLRMISGESACSIGMYAATATLV